ncbi:MAG: ribosome-associated translation inhibitor RaiA [Chloroflexota bacterium]|nr:ribosome-associated translation inhibitor RaiA [Chloroflexota bacterium]
MRTIVKGKNYDVPDADRRYAERKMQRLERLLDDRVDAVIELSLEHHRSGDSHIAEVTLVVDGPPLRGAASGATHHEALDTVVDKLERQAVAYKKKFIDRHRPGGGKSVLRSLAEGTADAADDGLPDIVKVKRFAIEPMFEEDAVARMEELGHSFFIFVNAENERLNVLYRRNDGNYGLIEPTVGGNYTLGSTGRRP